MAVPKADRDRRVVAYYCTGHGLGHATRVIEVARELIRAAEVQVVVCSSLPDDLFIREFAKDMLLGRFRYRKIEPLDCGGIQRDAFRVEPVASLETYWSLCGSAEARREKIAREKTWLESNRVRFVLSDTVPVALRCASECGIPSAVVSNLSWDFIYGQFLKMPEVAESGSRDRYAAMVEDIVEDYKCATFLFRLPGAHPMPAFDGVEPTLSARGLLAGRGGPWDSLVELFMAVEREEREEIDASSSEDGDVPHTKVFEMPFVVRRARTSREEVRRNLGVLPDAKLLVLMLGGLSGDASWSVDGDDTLPAGWVCGVTAPAWPEGAGLGDRFFRLPHDAYLPDIILASDAVIGKIGYGSVSECVSLMKPLIFVPRANFAEEGFLRLILEETWGGVELSRDLFEVGRWREAVERAAAMRPQGTGERNDGGEKCALAVLACMDCQTSF